MQINIDDLTPEQKEFIDEYKRIHNKLEELQRQMAKIQDETKDMIDLLEKLRTKENKIFKNGKK